MKDQQNMECYFFTLTQVVGIAVSQIQVVDINDISVHYSHHYNNLKGDLCLLTTNKIVLI